MNLFLIASFFIASQAIIMPAMAENNAKNELQVQRAAINAEIAELVRIKQEKLAIETNSKVRQAACYKNFAVSECLKDEKIETQAALNKVKRRELELRELQRNAKTESKQSEAGKATTKNADGDVANEAKDKTKADKAIKPGKTMKSDAEIAVEKNMADRSRAEAAEKRLVAANQKQAASQKKAQMRANINNQSAANSAKYAQKLTQAEEHKQALEKARLVKNKAKSAPLPIPPLIPPTTP